ncbi:hypothetical protein J7T55_011050 [Diaporthe amygdali]|uniref:uncharacterized protein n=1 Tax=Phomopsis amygdali TaxID=1214568 RepID=UPI0022FEB4A8|nr:uncharacterized protein J7T55_011050 [Diaporthe amygdali]KAJ0106955.1 hypothetical protein J7T55_011050 [Diaporthe amygdali]
MSSTFSGEDFAQQDQSLLFSKLPLEIRRQIYQQLWSDHGLTQHIFLFSQNSYLQSFPCSLSPEQLNQDPSSATSAAGSTDEIIATPQFEPFDDPGDIDGALQELTLDDEDRLLLCEPPCSTWCMHHVCFYRWIEKWDKSFSKVYSASYRGNTLRPLPDPRSSPVLAVFLACKQAHQEASESLFSTMRFSFSSLNAMHMFLEQVPQPMVSRIQYADVLSIDGDFLDPSRSSADYPAPAQKVYQTLDASFPKLKELRLTLHASWYSQKIPRKRDLQPLYTLAHKKESLRKFEVFLPTQKSNSKVGYGEIHPSLKDAPFSVKLVPPCCRVITECHCFWT